MADDGVYCLSVSSTASPAAETLAPPSELRHPAADAHLEDIDRAVGPAHERAAEGGHVHAPSYPWVVDPCVHFECGAGGG